MRWRTIGVTALPHGWINAYEHEGEICVEPCPALLLQEYGSEDDSDTRVIPARIDALASGNEAEAADVDDGYLTTITVEQWEQTRDFHVELARKGREQIRADMLCKLAAAGVDGVRARDLLGRNGYREVSVRDGLVRDGLAVVLREPRGYVYRLAGLMVATT